MMDKIGPIVPPVPTAPLRRKKQGRSGPGGGYGGTYGPTGRSGPGGPFSQRPAEEDGTDPFGTEDVVAAGSLGGLVGVGAMAEAGEARPGLIDQGDAVRSPAMRRMIADLIAELEVTKSAQADAESRASYWEGLADEDGDLPVLNRRATVSLLSGRLQRAWRAHVMGDAWMPPAIALFYLDNFEKIRRTHGLMAAQMVLSRAAMTLFQCWGLTHPVGTIGGASLLVILDGPGPALMPLDQVIRRMADHPLRWHGTMLPAQMLGTVTQARRTRRSIHSGNSGYESSLEMIARVEAEIRQTDGTAPT